MAERIGKVSEDMYLGKPLSIYEGVFNYVANDPHFGGGESFGKEYPIDVTLAVHPNTSGRVIINVPGAMGDIDGYVDKYKRLAHYMQSEDLGAVVRTDNHFREGYLADVNLRKALWYTGNNASETCGDPRPEVLLMGFSAGASAIAAISHEYSEVSKMLLYAPSGDMPKEMVEKGLKKFDGEVVIVIGENDEVVGPKAGKLFYDLATGASKRELIMIPDCDYQFRGETNGRIMSQAPFYAFARGDKPQFPDPNGGIKLY